MPIKSFLARRAERRGLPHRKARTQIASHVVIRKPVSWQRRLFWGVLIALASAGAGLALFLAGQFTAGYDSIDTALRIRDLETAHGHLETRNHELSSTLETLSTQLHIEQGARKAMESQIAKLEEERARLNRDLALFDNLFPSNGDNGQPSIRGFLVEPASPGGSRDAWRYRLLIMRPGQPADTFSGELHLRVRYSLGGREVQADAPATGKLVQPLEFQRYQRVEGNFQSPPGAKMLGATARVMENGRPVAESAFKP